MTGRGLPPIPAIVLQYLPQSGNGMGPVNQGFDPYQGAYQVMPDPKSGASSSGFDPMMGDCRQGPSQCCAGYVAMPSCCSRVQQLVQQQIQNRPPVTQQEPPPKGEDPVDVNEPPTKGEPTVGEQPPSKGSEPPGSGDKNGKQDPPAKGDSDSKPGQKPPVAQGPDKPHAPDQKPLSKYTVVQGDTLSCIAQEYGVTWQQLYWQNRDQIKHPDLIYPGQVFEIPKSDLHVPHFDYKPMFTGGAGCKPGKSGQTPPQNPPPKGDKPKGDSGKPPSKTEAPPASVGSGKPDKGSDNSSNPGQAEPPSGNPAEPPPPGSRPTNTGIPAPPPLPPGLG